MVAFRGTYSLGDVVRDLSSIKQEYVPYDPDEGPVAKEMTAEKECMNCSVHAGFMRAWTETRQIVLPTLDNLVSNYPGYRVTLVGHSLGGAVAALAALELISKGWEPQLTTFGEPRIGNDGLVKYLDDVFAAQVARTSHRQKSSDIWDDYRRVTHVNDPVPLLPLTDWGYRMHAGEVYISKATLPPGEEDVRYCNGDEDPDCIAGAEPSLSPDDLEALALQKLRDGDLKAEGIFEIPARWRIWQLFFSHRDYFWRLGLCIPGGDPADWHRKDRPVETGEL